MKLTSFAILMVLSLASSSCYQKGHLKTRHNKWQSRVRHSSKADEQDEDETMESLRRLKSHLIEDPRIDTPDDPKPFAHQFVKSKEDLAKYIQQKEDSPVQKKFIANPVGSDPYPDASLGVFHVIQDQQHVCGEHQVFMNDFALYYTAKKEVGQANSYRNIRGSVPFKAVVNEKEAHDISTGAKKCCSKVPNVMFYKMPEYKSLKEVKELPAEFRSTVTKFCKDDDRAMTTMICLQVSYEFGGTDRDIAICSQITNQVIQLKAQLTQRLIKMAMKENGITDYTVVETNAAEEELMKDGKDYEQFRNWSYEKYLQWPRECKAKKMTQAFKSPIIIPETVFEEQRAKKLSAGEGDDENSNFVVKWESLRVSESVDPLWMSQADKTAKSMAEDLKNYYMHPTYTYHGLHENFILGQLGTLTIGEESKVSEAVGTYSAFAIKFKLPGEHRFDQTTYNGELQVHMMRIKEDQKETLSSYKQLIGINGQGSLAERQFGLGYTEVDALKVEKLVNDLTDLVLAIPIQSKSDLSTVNLFMHYLNHEDWFEASGVSESVESYFDSKQAVRVSNKDLESPKVQNSESLPNNDKGEESIQQWERSCYPGSMSCLFDQIKTKKTFYYYQGTITTPPCAKAVKYLVFKQPIQVSKEDFNSLRKNVFQYREQDEGRGNANRFLTYVSEKNVVDQKRVVRQLDTSEITCGQSEQMKQFIKNSILESEQEGEQPSFSQDALTQNSGAIVQNSKMQNKESIQAMLDNSDLKEKLGKEVGDKEWEEWFEINPIRHYRRKMSEHKLTNTVSELKLIAQDALSGMYNFDYTIKGEKSEVEDENPNEASLVMVSGQVKHQQSLSAKSIRKVKSVIEAANKSQEGKDQEAKEMSNFVTMTIKDAKRRRKLRK